MSEYLPREVRDGLTGVRRPVKGRRQLRVETASGDSFTILKHWSGGFTVASEEALRMRGLVDVYDGDVRILQCLVVATAEDAGETTFEFKRRTPCVDGPALDYAPDGGLPVRLM